MSVRWSTWWTLARLFGAHVVRRAGDVARARDRALRLVAREPEVNELHVAGGIEQEVRGLDVAVHDAVLVRVLERVCGVARNVGYRSEIIPGLAGGQLRRDDALLFERFAQPHELNREVVPLDELHRKVIGARELADGEHRHDARMLELRDRARLAQEALDLARRQGQARRQHLDRHASAERALPGLEDHAHAAASDLRQEIEVTELSLFYVRRQQTFRVRRGSPEEARLGGSDAQHAQDLLAELALGTALLLDESRAVFDGQVEGKKEQTLDLLPAFGVHRAPANKSLCPRPGVRSLAAFSLTVLGDTSWRSPRSPRRAQRTLHP